ncbi:MAG: phosphate acyltransferase PlsX [Bacteroidetes bacterium]|nr:phosphate acyltransferase PlsX [Bacteroidota bacterium]MDA1332862.1 phosphate acyltransferase PlsX [Bacteroidota bacterium]
MPTRIAVDAMGGDNAPGVVVEGAAMALASGGNDIHVLLTGPEDRINPLVAVLDESVRSRISVVHAPDVIGMDDSPATAIKTKQHSSIHVGMGLCKARKADAFVSAGNTGAVMAGGLFILGRLPGVSRPSVIGYFPTLQGTCVLLDVGTNVDCKPEHLVQFAQMGSVYVKQAMGVENPTVALMNVGEEPGKGDDLAKASYDALKEASGINFVGNIEGRDLMRHAADVVVCDGFVGNVLLKYGESVAAILPMMIGAEMQRLSMPPEEQAIVGKALKGVKARFDYKEFGGAPLLGVDGNVLIGHGSSNGYAIKNLILAADTMIKGHVSATIAEAIG